MTYRIMYVFILGFLLGGFQVSAKNPYNRRGDIIGPAPTTDEIDDWFLELAGTDPDRRTAVKRWLEPNGPALVASYVEDCFVRIDFIDIEVSVRELGGVALFPEIEILRFERAKFSDEALEALANQTHITSIESYDGRYLDNRFCRAVGKLSNLDGLRLINSQIDDEGAEYLSKLDKLSGLDLSGSRVTSLTLARLSRLKNLKGLGLAATAVGDDGLRHIATLPNLVSLQLDDTKVTDTGIEHLRSLDLIAITLGNTAVTDRTVRIIAGMERMTKVHLQGTQITNEAVRLLAPLPKLGHELNLKNTAIDDGCVPYFEKMTTKPRIDLRGTKITEEGMKRIRAALSPKAALYNDHGVAVIDHARLKR